MTNTPCDGRSNVCSLIRNHAGFFSWYVVLVEEPRRLLIGLVGMKGTPDERGIVEIGYSILEKYQRPGFWI